jgi:hypothetical protein
VHLIDFQAEEKEEHAYNYIYPLIKKLLLIISRPARLIPSQPVFALSAACVAEKQQIPILLSLF